MYFYWDYTQLRGFFFGSLNIDTLTKCLISIFVVFVLAFVNESAKILQKLVNTKLEIKWNNNTNKSSNVLPTSLQNEANETTFLIRPLHIPVHSRDLKKRKLIIHSLQSLIYTFNLGLAFIIMNISMGYYSGHFMAIVVGYGFGYYFLHVISPDSNQFLSKTCENKTESDEPCTRSNTKNEREKNEPCTSSSLINNLSVNSGNGIKA